MRFRWQVTAFLWSMLFACICRADSPPPVAPVYEQPYVVTPSAAPLALEIPLALSGIDTAVCAEKVGVRYQHFVSEAASQHFVLDQRLLEKGKAAPRLRVTLAKSAAMRPGDYHLRVRFHQCNNPGAVPVAQAVYTITVPYAGLQARGKQIIDVRLGSPWSDAAFNPASISIERDTNNAFVPIRQPTIMAEPFSNGSSATVGRWEDVNLATVAPHQPVRFNLAAQDFPPGTANGQLVLRSPDLEAPYRIDVEVRARLHPAWMLLPIVAGFILGQWLRHRLQGRIDLGEARQLAIDALARFEREAERITDPAFQGAAGQLLAELFRTIRSGNKDQVQSQLAAARTEFESLQTELQASLKAVTKNIEDYQNAFGVVGILPSPLDKLPQRVDRDVDFCLGLVAALSPSDAKRELARRSRDAMSLLGDGVHSAQSAAASLDVELRVAAAVLSPASRAGLDADLTAFKAALQAMVPVTQQTEAHAALTALTLLRYAAGQLLNRHAQALDSTARQLDEMIRLRIDQTRPLPPALTAFMAPLAAIAADMRAQAAANPFVLHDWPSRTAGALDAVRSALLAMIASRADLTERVGQLQAQVNSEHWYDTFAKVNEFNPVHGALPASANPVALEAPLVPTALAPAPARAALEAPAVDRFTLPEIDLEDHRNRSALKRSHLLMTIGTGAIMAAASYAVYEDKFIGSNLELLGLFIWGFSADMTLSGLLERLTPLKGTGLAGQGAAGPAGPAGPAASLPGNPSPP